MLDASDDDDEEEEEEAAVDLPVSVKASAKASKAKAPRFTALDASDDEEEERGGEEAGNVALSFTGAAVGVSVESSPSLMVETPGDGAAAADDGGDGSDDGGGTAFAPVMVGKKASKRSKDSEGAGSGLSKQEKKEFKDLKAKKEKDGLNKEEKRRYKELKSRKHGGGENDDEQSSASSYPAPRALSALGGWPPAKGTTSEVWPPPVTTAPTAALAAEPDPVADLPAAKEQKAPKMTKLQAKMEAARLAKEDADRQRALDAAEASAGLKAAVPPAAAEKEEVIEAPSTKPAGRREGKPAAAPVAIEEQQKRVFNLGDDDTWRDASVPGSVLSDDGPAPLEFGPDGKKLSKKEFKKAQKDWDNRQREKVDCFELLSLLAPSSLRSRCMACVAPPFIFLPLPLPFFFCRNFKPNKCRGASKEHSLRVLRQRWTKMTRHG